MVSAFNYCLVDLCTYQCVVCARHERGKLNLDNPLVDILSLFIIFGAIL